MFGHLFPFSEPLFSFPCRVLCAGRPTLQQAASTPGSRLVWPVEAWAGIRGREEVGRLRLYCPSPLFVMSSALAAFLDGLMFSINCPSPHHFFVSKFQWPPCLSGLWVSTGTTNSQLHCPLRFPACCPQHCRQALC